MGGEERLLVGSLAVRAAAHRLRDRADQGHRSAAGAAKDWRPYLGGVGVEAKPPRDTFNDMDIVNGFLEAMSDSQGALDIARQYMTPEAAAAWKPESGTVVYDQRPDALARRAGGIQLTRSQDRDDQPARRVDPRAGERAGRLLLQADQGERAVPGRLGAARGVPGQQPGGSEARPARSVLLHAGREMLVPDPVYLPVNLSSGQAATQLVQELLKGPTGRLGNGVITLAPAGHRGPGVGAGRVRAWRPSRSTTRPRRSGTRTAGCWRPRSSGRSTRSACGSRSPSAAHRCCRTTRTCCRSRTSASTTRPCPAAR